MLTCTESGKSLPVTRCARHQQTRCSAQDHGTCAAAAIVGCLDTGSSCTYIMVQHCCSGPIVLVNQKYEARLTQAPTSPRFWAALLGSRPSMCTLACPADGLMMFLLSVLQGCPVLSNAQSDTIFTSLTPPQSLCHTHAINDIRTQLHPKQAPILHPEHQLCATTVSVLQCTGTYRNWFPVMMSDAPPSKFVLVLVLLQRSPTSSSANAITSARLAGSSSTTL